LIKGYDGKDRYYLEALGAALDGKEVAYYQEFTKTKPDPTQWDAATAGLIWRLHPLNAVDDLRKRAEAAQLPEAGRREALVALGFIKDKKAAQAMVELTKSKLPDVAAGALWWVNYRRTNDWLDVLNWEETIATQFSASGQKMLKLQEQIIAANQPRAAKVEAALAMARDPEGGKMLLSLAAAGKLPDAIRDTLRHHIFNNPDQTVRVMASDYFRKENNVSYPIGLITKLQATATSGHKLFSTYCTTCHTHGTEGRQIGPDLTLIHKKFDKVGLLDAIINPSAGLAFGYEPWRIRTKSGASYYGFLISDAAAVVIKDAAGQQHVIRKEQIQSREQLATSLMPDPAAFGLKEQDLADLAAYLMQMPEGK
jgi:putative heme-binding domain-containing protein